MIIGLTGSLAAGKGVVSNFLKEKGFVYLSLSDELREIVKENKIEITRENLQNFGNFVRQNYGSGFLADKAIYKIKNQKYRKAIVDGIRNPVEIQSLREKLEDFFLVSIDAPQEVRYNRLVERQRESDPKTLEDFVRIDNKDKGIGELESGQAVAKCMQLADITIFNSGSLNEVKEKVRIVYEDLKKKTYKIPSFDDRMMSMVYLLAEGSKDERTHIGAVVIGPDKEIRTTGYNSFVRGLNDNLPERQEKPEKFYWFEHAERNGMDNATLIGSSLKGCKMYTNGIPCTNCARGIIQSGILEVIVDEKWNKTNKGEDLEESKRTIQMFKETGVKIRYWNGELIELKKFRRGEIMEETE